MRFPPNYETKIAYLVLLTQTDYYDVYMCLLAHTWLVVTCIEDS